MLAEGGRGRDRRTHLETPVQADPSRAAALLTVARHTRKPVESDVGEM